MNKIVGIAVCAVLIILILTFNLLEHSVLQTTEEPTQETEVSLHSPKSNKNKSTEEKEIYLSKEVGFDFEKSGKPFKVLKNDLLQVLRGTKEDTIFSEKTAGMLNGVSIKEDGTAIIDFKDFRDTIPSPSSAEKRKISKELHSVVFNYPEVSKVYYQFNGSASAWWSWLEAYPEPITREDWIEK
ncbi:hypothetical protein [Pontibacillus marinus]|uniref:Uncharacterized protein n=1 Tax=Pontibacillus marinus BH030004 = DSM 16465 TaxID=1385511 RepID=A0A0A5G8Z5_9BACI|nr:hypothetical protein [Pontibacillus marinus]KGX87653.1 hypothetical protein N783_09555 [Pontibacillus marinus BH030004 = DSM 16465]